MLLQYSDAAFLAFHLLLLFNDGAYQLSNARILTQSSARADGSGKAGMKRAKHPVAFDVPSNHCPSDGRNPTLPFFFSTFEDDHKRKAGERRQTALFN